MDAGVWGDRDLSFREFRMLCTNRRHLNQPTTTTKCSTKRRDTTITITHLQHSAPSGRHSSARRRLCCTLALREEGGEGQLSRQSEPNHHHHKIPRHLAQPL